MMAPRRPLQVRRRLGRRLRAQRRRGAGACSSRSTRALADGDRIYAVIRGSAVNNDGRSSGSLGTAEPRRPGGDAARGLRRRRRARRRGSATSRRTAPARAPATRSSWRRSAPCSATAARPARTVPGRLGQDQHRPHRGRRRRRRPDQGGAGAAARTRSRPACTSWSRTRPCPGPSCRCAIPTRHGDWPAVDGPRVAGVSSFGIAGTNAHVVLEEAPPAATSAARGPAACARRCCRCRREARRAARLAGPLRRPARAAKRPVAAPTSAGAPRPAARRSSIAPSFVADDRGRRWWTRCADSSPAKPPAAEGVVYHGQRPKIGVRVPRPGRAVARHGPRAAGQRAGLPRRAATSATRRRGPIVDWSIVEQLHGRARQPPTSSSTAIDVIQPVLVALAIAYADCGGRSASSRTRSSATAWARSPPRTWPARSISTRRCASSAGAAR